MGIADSLDLTPNQRKVVVSLLTRYIPGVSVWAYGSRVKWTSRPDSDLDLVVFVPPEKRGRISALKEAFEESSLPFRLDLMVWDEVPENFRKNILEQYLVLVENPAEKPQKDLAVSDWRSSKWGDEISLEYGKALRGYESSSGPFRVYGSNGPVGWTTQALAPGPGVILGRKGAYRGVQFSKEPFFVIDTAYYVVPKTQLDMRWVYYAIKHYKLGEIDDGSPIPSTTRAAVYVMDLDVPPLPEQRAIGNILGTLDDKIELNRRMNETLEAMARALFKSWFVDFEPVRAKSEERDTGLPKEIADLFPDSFEDSELGELPKGWKVGTLADLAALNPESWSKDTRPDFIQYVDLTNTKWGRIEATTGYTIAEAPSRAQRVLRPLDTIVGTVRPANGSYAFITEEGFTGSTGFAVLRPKSAINAEYVYLAATSPENIESLAHLADGGAYPAVRPEVVSATTIILPSESILLKFSQMTAPLLEKFGRNIRESMTIAEQRDTLLPKLLSGEVRVSIKD